MFYAICRFVVGKMLDLWLGFVWFHACSLHAKLREAPPRYPKILDSPPVSTQHGPSSVWNMAKFILKSMRVFIGTQL